MVEASSPTELRGVGRNLLQPATLWEDMSPGHLLWTRQALRDADAYGATTQD